MSAKTPLDRTKRRRGAHLFGLNAETIAAWLLRLKGYSIVAQRFAVSGGEIDLIVGQLAATGTAYTPGILGTLGIAAGGTKARNLSRARPVSFASLKGGAPAFVPFGTDGAIYEQFYAGNGASCGDD